MALLRDRSLHIVMMKSLRLLFIVHACTYVLCAVGEPLNDEAWLWYHNVVGRGKATVVDTWWQTGKEGVGPFEVHVKVEAMLCTCRDWRYNDHPTPIS